MKKRPGFYEHNGNLYIVEPENKCYVFKMWESEFEKAVDVADLRFHKKTIMGYYLGLEKVPDFGKVHLFVEDPYVFNKKYYGLVQAGHLNLCLLPAHMFKKVKISAHKPLEASATLFQVQIDNDQTIEHGFWCEGGYSELYGNGSFIGAL